LLLVLDSNEYIFGLGLSREPDCEKLIDTLREKHSKHTVRIPRLIVGEVRKNLSPEVFKEFILFINQLTTIDEDILIPFELAAKYGANALVTENRHFLSRKKDLPFQVVTAEKFLTTL